MSQTQIQHELGRAKNALQSYMIHKLLIPKVFLDAELTGLHVDVLAIDRAGVGDVHAVRTFPLSPGNGLRAAFVLFASKLEDTIEEIRTVPSHFRYVAVVSDDPGAYEFRPSDVANLSRIWLAEDGVGRVGILYVDLSQDDPSVQVVLKAERFRSSKEIVDLADRYVAEHTANWEVRE